MRSVYWRGLGWSLSGTPVQYIELSVFVRGREARKRTEDKKSYSPTSLLANGANAQEALTNATTCAKSDSEYSRIMAMRCARLPSLSAKEKESGRE